MRDTACKWIQNNKQRWEGWKPVETNCDEGFGMIDGQGNFVATRTNAVAFVLPALHRRKCWMMMDGLFNASNARQATASPTHIPPNVSHARRATLATTMAARSVQHVV